MTDRDLALVDAVVEEAVEVGLVNLSAERIGARAGIPQSAFDERFSSEQEAVEATHEMLFDRFVNRLVRACDAQPTWPLKVKVGIGVALDLAAASPVRARFLLLDSLGADRTLVLTAIESRERLARLLACGRAESPQGTVLPAITEQMLIAGLSGAILARLVGGEAEHLPALAPQLVEHTLRFYLGPEEAAEVARRPRPIAEGL